jgi:hypothetical protein
MVEDFLARWRSAFRHPQQKWIAFFIFAGCLCRLVWPADMKWQADEIWMYETARAVADDWQAWPMLGMNNGVGFLNPGLSVWCFIALAKVTSDPVAMMVLIALSNVLAILLFAGFVRRYVRPSLQSIWLWGSAFVSVNPLAVNFSRAIWATDILPLWSFGVFVSHWWRDRRWGAYAWGLIGTLIGQVHMSGFLWQSGLVLWTIWHEGRGKAKQKTRWLFWLLGTIIGIIPLWPWLQQIANQVVTADRPSFAELLTPNFHLHWLLGAWGLGIEYEYTSEFWRSALFEPRIFGVPTFGVAIVHLALAVIAVGALIRWWLKRSATRRRHLIHPDRAMNYWWAGGLVMPLLLLFVRVRVPAHYLVVLFPLPQAWAAWLLHDRQRLLISACILQLLITIFFLVDVHRNGGIANGDYGLTYRAQM